MRSYARFTLLLSLAMLWGCSNTVLVSVTPRMDLKGYGTLGIVEFASNSDRAINARATQQFQEQVQTAQPGTRFIELGNRDALLASVGARQLDVDAARRIGQKYGVAALFVGDIAYSEPRTDVKLTDLTKMEGGVRSEIRGDISSRLLETSTGASVWSSSPWAERDWSPDQGLLARATIAGERVTIENLRNFSYQSTSEYAARYETRSYDLGKLDSVWFIVERFGDAPAIAHTFLSFGFGDEYLAISVEIRKERGETYSPLKGLARQFELMYVIADERDVIGLRTNHRRDPVYLYPVTTTPDKM